MIKRIVAVVALVICVAAIAAYALGARMPQSTEIKASEISRILIINNPPALNEVGANFMARMSEIGYEAGIGAEYVEIDVGTDVSATRTRIADEFTKKEFDMIYSTGVTATRAAKEFVEAEGRSTPIVFGVVSNPVDGGLVKSLRSSGNNLTGITPASNVAVSKRLEFLRDILPETKRVIISWNDEYTSGIARLRDVTRSLGIELIEHKAANVQDMNAFFSDYSYKPGDAIMRATDGVSAGALPSAIAAGIRNNVPVIGTNYGDTERGALMSYGADYSEIGRASARLADLVLQGIPPTDIPIEEASRFEISVNLKTARTIGVIIPQQFLLKTNRVVAE